MQKQWRFGSKSKTDIHYIFQLYNYTIIYLYCFLISTAIMSWSLLVAIEQSTGRGRPSGKTDSALIVLWGFAFAWKVLKSFKAILNRKCLTSFSEHPLQRRWCSDFQEHWTMLSTPCCFTSRFDYSLHWTNASSSEMLIDFAWILCGEVARRVSFIRGVYGTSNPAPSKTDGDRIWSQHNGNVDSWLLVFSGPAKFNHNYKLQSVCNTIWWYCNFMGVVCSYANTFRDSTILLLTYCETWDLGGVQVLRAPNQDSGLVIFCICDLQSSRPSLSSVWQWSIVCNYTDTEWGSKSSSTSGHKYPNRIVCVHVEVCICLHTHLQACICALAWLFLLWSYI